MSSNYSYRGVLVGKGASRRDIGNMELRLSEARERELTTVPEDEERKKRLEREELSSGEQNWDHPRTVGARPPALLAEQSSMYRYAPVQGKATFQEYGKLPGLPVEVIIDLP